MSEFKCTPMSLMLAASRYDKRCADFAVNFIQSLKLTKGEYGKTFMLML